MDQDPVQGAAQISDALPSAADEQVKDPRVQEFEDYLIANLKPSDVLKDEHGKHMFNANQVAYLVEGVTDENGKRVTRKRLASGITKLQYVSKRVPHSNTGTVCPHFLEMKTPILIKIAGSHAICRCGWAV
jgi:hypothetical protein